MNQRNDNSNDEFESRLSQFSLIAPSDNYRHLADKLPRSSHTTGLLFKKWISSAAAICAIAVVAISFNLLNPPSDYVDSQVTGELSTRNTTTNQSSLAATPNNTEPEYVEGRNYIELARPVLTESTQTEVVAFFWYPCWPCSEFEEHLLDWESKLGDDIVLTRIPAIWSSSMRFHAQAYYTAQLLGVEENVHQRFYLEFERDNPNISSEADLQRFFESTGVSSSEFLSAYHSDTVSALVQRAEAMNQAYQLQSTPTVFVAGKYSISPANAGGFSEVLEVADYLIENL